MVENIMWITSDLKKTNKNLPVFYRKFKVRKQLRNCLLDVSALGIFSIKINGCEIDNYFMPGWTNYGKVVNLCAYDLTKYVKEENLLEITLADGWYSGRLGYTGKSNVYGEINALFAQIKLEFQDGSEEVIESDESWRVGRTNICTSSFFDGEKVDFTFVDKRKFSALPRAKKVEKNVEFRRYDYEPVKKIDQIIPIVIHEEKGLIRLDFKQNFAGFVTFRARGNKGFEITVKHAEVLCDDGKMYYDNLRSVKATDRVVLSGEEDYFEPKFTFHGFRYAEITFDEGTEIFDIKGVVLSQNIEYNGKFECSCEIINSIYKNAKWGQKSNFISIPIDCPQRDERLGWTGDAQVFCNSAMFNANCEKFFENYLNLIRDDILPDGKIPSFVPFFIPVSVSTAGVSGWADSICVIPYYHYLHYGNKKVLKDNVSCAISHLNYYLSNSQDYLLKVENPFGDWLSVEKFDDKEVISQCFLGLSASLISKSFAILEDEENHKKYQEIFEGAKEAFRREFLCENGKIKGNSQTAYALALSVGYVTASEIKEHFVKSIENADFKLTTGFIGVKYLLPALCEIGREDLAYRIIKETDYPSWGYTIKNGATTIWERWNGYTKEHGFETPSMNSFNHYSLGSCVEWLYSYVLGVKLLDDGKVVVSPLVSNELEYAKGECATRYGRVFVEWKRVDGKFAVKVEFDEKVPLEVDFRGKEIISIEKIAGKISATVK